MSAVPQRALESDKILPTEPETNSAGMSADRQDPLRLLREVIDSLNSSEVELPDQGEVEDLLAAARQALERVTVVGRAQTQCQELIKETKFEKALEVLDECLRLYPGDPALSARRGEVEEHQRAFLNGMASQRVLEEAQWLLDQDRPDLAASLLKGKASELPDQAELMARLKTVEAMLPQWEKSRCVRTTLEQAAALEQVQQWQAALTVLEEALQTYPATEALVGAARRVRTRLADREREKRLSLRLKLIAQRIATQSWQAAWTLLQEAHKEFPNAPELDPLKQEVETGLRRSHCEAVVAEVRQCIEDGQLELAEQALKKGRETLGPEPALEPLAEQLESEMHYRLELRTAQMLFGRRQLQEAEAILARLLAPNRPEAQALLDAVRQAHAAAEEGDFCERGREKVLRLMQQEQYSQAYDLLTNLRTLFPNNPILERDLVGVQFALALHSTNAPPAAAPEPVEKETAPPEAEALLAPPSKLAPAPVLAPPLAVPAGPLRTASGSRGRRVAAVGAASLMLASVGGAAWKLTRSSPATKASAVPAAVPPAAADAPQSTTPAAAAPAVPETTVSAPTNAAQSVPVKTASGGTGRNAGERTPPAASLRPFVQPASQQGAAPSQTPRLPVPPGAGPTVSAETTLSLPAGLVKPSSVPTPVPPPQPSSTAPPAAAKPAVPIGGNVQEAQLVERTMPVYPPVAIQLGISGEVRLIATIDERGNVNNVSIAGGDAILAKAAAEAVQKWKYKPATLNGKPISVSLAIQMSFNRGSK